uniref:Uncharacterized protein n=1 Tax=viral metagenome TaxID=1070528 RepID=A0A6C0E9B2_9ZZZZ
MDIESEVKKQNPNHMYLYQLQHLEDKQYKFMSMGLFEKGQMLNIANFEFNNFYINCISYIETEKQILESKRANMIGLHFSPKSDKEKITASLDYVVKFDEINLQDKNTGKLSIILSYLANGNKVEEIIENDISCPNKDELIYSLVSIISHEKISKIFCQKG